MNHVLKRVQIDLTVGDEALARDLMDRCSRMFAERIAPQIERVCDAIDDPPRPRRWDRVEVDLGRLPLAAFEDEFLRALADALRAALTRVPDSRGSPAEVALELLAAFAATGNLPWWADRSQGDPVAAALTAATASPRALIALLRDLSADPPALARLARHAGTATLVALARQVWPADHAAALADRSELADGAGADDRAALHRTILGGLARDDPPDELLRAVAEAPRGALDERRGVRRGPVPPPTRDAAEPDTDATPSVAATPADPDSLPALEPAYPALASVWSALAAYLRDVGLVDAALRFTGGPARAHTIALLDLLATGTIPGISLRTGVRPPDADPDARPMIARAASRTVPSDSPEPARTGAAIADIARPSDETRLAARPAATASGTASAGSLVDLQRAYPDLAAHWTALAAELRAAALFDDADHLVDEHARDLAIAAILRRLPERPSADANLSAAGGRPDHAIRPAPVEEPHDGDEPRPVLIAAPRGAVRSDSPNPAPADGSDPTTSEQARPLGAPGARRAELHDEGVDASARRPHAARTARQLSDGAARGPDGSADEAPEARDTSGAHAPATVDPGSLAAHPDGRLAGGPAQADPISSASGRAAASTPAPGRGEPLAAAGPRSPVLPDTSTDRLATTSTSPDESHPSSGDGSIVAAAPTSARPDARAPDASAAPRAVSSDSPPIDGPAGVPTRDAAASAVHRPGDPAASSDAPVLAGRSGAPGRSDPGPVRPATHRPDPGPTLVRPVHTDMPMAPDPRVRALVAGLRERLAAPARAPRPAPAEARRRALAQLDALYVDDAGLVLLWPFLERLFARVGLLDERRRFRGPDEPMTAVALLSYVVAGDPDPPEYVVALAKLLCGLGPADPYALARPLAPAQLAEGDRLLVAVLDHLPVLGDISVDGLRAAFLRRSAALRTRDGAWLLQVERADHDVLLDRFPWTWTWVKLPWMPDPLRVEW